MEEFENIYRTYFQDVFLYIRSLSHSEDIAEEITAETFFRALKSLDSFKGTCDVRVWLCQIARNCYFSYLRKQKKISSADGLPEQADEFDTLRFLLRSEETARIHGIIHTLAEPYKEVFMLRVFGELSFRQIARLFQKSENWACVTYHRAKAKITERLEDQP